MGRRAILLLAILGLGVTASVAEARRAPKPKLRTVVITSEPDGATVYVDDTETGPRGETPLTLSLTAGEHVLILERAGYQTRFEALTVEWPKRRADQKKPQEVAFTLEPAVATLVVAEPEGAQVLVDAVEVGVAPLSVEVEAGAHAVQVVVAGREPYQEFVDFPGGEIMTITAILGPPLPAVDDGEEPPMVAPPRSAGAARALPLVASIGYQYGTRVVEYRASRTPATLLPLEQDGAAMLLGRLELGVGRLARVRALAPLALAVGVGVGVPQDVDSPGLGALTTTWQRLAADLWYRPTLVAPVQLVLGAGVVRERFAFDGSDEARAVVPDATYASLRGELGLRARLGPVVATATGEVRAVLAGGSLADRFAAADARAWGGRLGVEVALPAALVLGVEVGLVRTRWTFMADAAGTYDADGARDDVRGVAARVGRAF
ncbi:MAG: PEGA domain-containing protein [Kofleriaceae bacterium]